MALSDRSFSVAGRGAVLIESECVCVFSGSINLLFGDGSRGLCSSRIDFVLDNKLNGFGLPFLMTLLLEEDAWGSACESTETSDLEGPPTGRRVADLSLLDSITRLTLAHDIQRHLKRKDETVVVPVLVASFDDTFPAMAGWSVSLDMLSSVTGRAVSEFCRRLELFAAL
jgi:hypothetical protein